MGFCRNTHCVICDFTLVPKLWCHIFTLIVQPHISPHGSRGGGAPSCRLTELWNWPLHAALCFTDAVSAAIFFLLLEFVFTARMRLWLSIHNALTSIKLWHFSQITWAAISCFNTVTPQSMWVKDTIRDLSIKSIPTWDVFVGWRRDWTWTSGLSGRVVCNVLFHFETWSSNIWSFWKEYECCMRENQICSQSLLDVKKTSLTFLTFFFNHKNLVPTLPTMQWRYLCNWN